MNFNISSDTFEQIDRAEENAQLLYSSMQAHGVKIDLVYLFENQKRRRRRLRSLLNFFNLSISKACNFRLFLSRLILDIYHERSLKPFFSENLALITERIVQNNSDLGEHYVTFNWAEFKGMFRSAYRGGAITVFTVYIKIAIAHLSLVGFIKGLVESLNYSSSFLLIQILGGTLATKQPSATAPYIASALLKSMTEARRSIVALLRTQFIAVLGNLSVVFPVCFIISAIALKLDHPFLSTEKSLYYFQSTNFLGPSPLFAIFTGVLLFSSSLIAGWFENWTLLNRLHDRIKQNERMHSLIGVQKSQAFASFIGKNSNSLAANISLGFILGIFPQVLSFLGIPLEVRHITLAMGSFAAALPQVLMHGVDAWEMFNSLFGILIIGFFNLTVSFSLAFFLASISTKLNFSSLLSLLKAGFRLILTRPWLLIVPEEDSGKD